jgi:type IV pilus assembly protein PilA
MKTELKAKFLQHILNKKKNEEGFTLIELLVVIIIIGILSAIALPAFLNQANKARASEAKTIVGSLNRAQQAYILEAGVFVTAQTDFSKLELGIRTQTENFEYNLAALGTNPGVTAKGKPRTPGTSPAILKGYVGSVAVATQTGGQATSLSILCETIAPITSTGTLTDATYTAATATTPGDLECVAASQKEVK